MASRIGWYKLLNSHGDVLMVAPASTLVDTFKVSLAEVQKAVDTGEQLGSHPVRVEWHGEEWQVLGE